MFHPCQSLQHSSILPQKEGWGAAGVGGGNGGGRLFFQSTPAENLPLPHAAPSTPPAKRSSGEAAWQAQFLRGGIKLAHWLSQLPHNWPRSFLIPLGSVKDASQRVTLCFLGCWLLFWWSPRGFNLLAIHPHQNLQAHHSPTLARLSSQAHTARLQKQLTQRWVFFIPHLPGICWNSSLQKDTAAVNSPQPPQPVCLPLRAQQLGCSWVGREEGNLRRQDRAAAAHSLLSWKVLVG